MTDLNCSLLILIDLNCHTDKVRRSVLRLMFLCQCAAIAHSLSVRCPSACVVACLFAWMFICLLACLSVCMFAFWFTRVFACLSAWMFAYLFA